MDYDYEIIEAKMKSLPDDLQEAMLSFDTANKVQEIGKKHNMRIDQIGALGDVTSYVMLGLVPGRNFVSVLSKKAEIDEKTATEIGKEINTEIFDGIRESIRKIEERETANNNDLAKAGNINVIDKNKASEDVVSGINKPSMSEKDQQVSKAVTLDAIENPPAFVDRLLTGTVSSVTETVTKQVSNSTAIPQKPVAATAPAIPAAPSGPRVDPYREPIE